MTGTTLKRSQFLWVIGEGDSEFSTSTFEKTEKVNGKLDGTDYSIKGWIGAVKLPSDLKQDDSNNNKISILCRGKMAQDDILDSFS